MRRNLVRAFLCLLAFCACDSAPEEVAHVSSASLSSRGELQPHFRAAPEELQRLSVTAAGGQLKGHSQTPRCSFDGDRVVFSSNSKTLGNGKYQVYVKQRGSGEVTAVTRGNGNSLKPAVSGDGMRIVFQSAASNLVGGDTNALVDVFVWDAATGAVTSLTRGALGGASQNAALSGDGRAVAFESKATNLVAGDTNRKSDIFLADLASGTLERVSVTSSGAQASGASVTPSLSGDGRRLAFASAAPLVPEDKNKKQDIYVRDLGSGQMTRVVGPGGAEPNGGSSQPWLSGDGRSLAFVSAASNLVADDTNGVADVFVRDLVSGETRRLGPGSNPSLSQDGDVVVFETVAPNGYTAVFMHRRSTGATSQVSPSEANQASAAASVSGDGAFLAFHSLATNLVPGDTNKTRDVFGIGNPLPPGPRLLDFVTGSTHRPSASEAAVGDFNADGRADLVYAPSVQSLEMLLSGIDPGPSTPVPYQTEGLFERPTGSLSVLAAGDFNRDGHLDAVSAHTTGNWLHAGLGDGRFAPPQPIGGAPWLWALVADFNGDGWPDVACALDQSIGVFLGPDLASPSAELSAADLQGLAEVGDVDGNGFPDLVFCSRSETFVALGVGDGTFVLSSGPAAGSVSKKLVDLDRDGRLDLVVQGTLYAGRGDGTFVEGVALPEFANEVLVGFVDLDGDSLLDAVSCDMLAHYVYFSTGQSSGIGSSSLLATRLAVRPGLSGGGFGPAALSLPASRVRADVPGFKLADFDGDGALDVLAHGSTATLMRGLEGMAFLGELTLPVDADLNGDGRLDQLRRHGNEIQAWLGRGDGGFDPGPISAGAAGYSQSSLLADVTGDGEPDLCEADDKVAVVPGLGGGAFGAAVVSVPSPGRAVFLMSAGDLDGDGREDLVVRSDSRLLACLGNADGSLTVAASVATFGVSRRAELSDLDGDGRLDLISTSQTRWEIFSGQGDGTFGPVVNLASGLSGSWEISTRLADVNGDGVTDVVAVNGSDPNLAVRLGDGSGGFGPALLSPRGGGTRLHLARDLDDDGIVDLVVSGDQAVLEVHRGSGDGTFAAPLAFGALEDVDLVAAWDVIEDGLLDLVVRDGSTAGLLRARLR